MDNMEPVRDDQNGVLPEKKLIIWLIIHFQKAFFYIEFPKSMFGDLRNTSENTIAKEISNVQ